MVERATADLLRVASFSPAQFSADTAWMGHLHFANWVINELKPVTFVELGSHWGHSYFSFCMSVNTSGHSTKCYAVDTWQGDPHAGLYDNDVFNHVNSYNQLNYADFSTLLRMTFDDALSYFSDGTVDLLHIDGMHTYEAVKHDFESWLPKLAPGGVVLFHDTNVKERNFGVWKLWEELQLVYPHNIEFFHSHGLGVLQLGDAPDFKKLHWLNSDLSDKQQLRDYFSALGAKERERFELFKHRDLVPHLSRNVAERDGQLASLSQAIAERDGQLASLNQAITERDGQLASLNQAITERDGQLASLNQAVAVRDQQISLLLKSTSWRIMSPLRYVISMLRR